MKNTFFYYDDIDNIIFSPDQKIFQGLNLYIFMQINH